MEELGWGPIIGQVLWQFLPVWIALAATFTVSILFKRKLGLYGKLFDSPIGMAGFALVMFWVFTALFADMIITHDPIQVVSGMKNKVPGTPVPDGTGGIGAVPRPGGQLLQIIGERVHAFGLSFG